MKNYNMIIPNSMVLSQVYSLLNAMGNEYIKLIPNAVYNYIKDNKDDNYVPEYDLGKSLKDQNFNRKALSIICFLDLSYWCDECEKIKLKKELKTNNEKMIIYEKNLHNVFKKKEENNINNDVEKSITIIKKDNILKRLIKRISKSLKNRIK